MELPADFLSLGRGSISCLNILSDLICLGTVSGPYHQVCFDKEWIQSDGGN